MKEMTDREILALLCAAEREAAALILEAHDVLAENKTDRRDVGTEYDRRDLARQGLVLLLGGVDLPVQVLLLLLKAALLLGQLGSALLYLPLVLGAVFVYFFLCPTESFPFLARCTFARFV